MGIVEELSRQLDYCRRARRIRALGRDDPTQTQRELINLAGTRTILEHPILQSSGLDWSNSAILGYRGAAARDFADRVAMRLVGPLLTWSDRADLLRQATNRGIGRFEANLIIAAVQHHLYPQAARRTASAPLYSSWRFPLGFATAVAAQALIVVAVWHLLS